MIDPAMVRPGRFDKLLYVDLPMPSEMSEILRTLMRKVPLGASDERDMSTEQIREEIGRVITERCDGYSGADLAALVREAGVIALKRTLGALDEMEDVTGGAEETPKVTVGLSDFVKALDKVSPSVSVVQRRKYQNLRSKFAGLPVRMGKDEENKRVDTGNVADG
jgi:ribosome biogenesis ATPase